MYSVENYSLFQQWQLGLIFVLFVSHWDQETLEQDFQSTTIFAQEIYITLNAYQNTVHLLTCAKSHSTFHISH